MMLYVFLFFFFQAEDGIRDRTVTGVQTCALPIWLRNPWGTRPRRHGRRLQGKADRGQSDRGAEDDPRWRPHLAGGTFAVPDRGRGGGPAVAPQRGASLRG